MCPMPAIPEIAASALAESVIIQDLRNPAHNQHHRRERQADIFSFVKSLCAANSATNRKIIMPSKNR